MLSNSNFNSLSQSAIDTQEKDIATQKLISLDSKIKHLQDKAMQDFAFAAQGFFAEQEFLTLEQEAINSQSLNFDAKYSDLQIYQQQINLAQNNLAERINAERVKIHSELQELTKPLLEERSQLQLLLHTIEESNRAVIAHMSTPQFEPSTVTYTNQPTVNQEARNPIRTHFSSISPYKNSNSFTISKKNVFCEMVQAKNPNAKKPWPGAAFENHFTFKPVFKKNA